MIDKEKEKAKLEQLCTQWAALGPEDAGEKLNLQGKIFEVVYRLFPGYEDVIGAVFLTDWKGFDPAKGSAYGFFSSRTSLRKKDVYRAQKVYQDRIVEDTVRNDGGDEGESLLARLPAEPGKEPEERLRLEASVCALTAAMLELPQRLHGRANNSTRHNYFRMFYTDGVVTSLHNCPVREIFRKRERDMFTVMKLEFLDYFMAAQCRTVDEIADGQLKPYGELVEGREMEETALPLPDGVYMSYLDRVEHTKKRPSAVSQQRTAYVQMIRGWLF